LAAFGLEPSQPPEPDVHALWPDNWAAFNVFRRMLTQLNVGGMGGVVGLRYEALPIVLRVCQVPRADLPDVMDCIQLMERHMVRLLNEKK
jgi:hypothetical protein